MKKRYIFIALSIIYIVAIIVIRLPKALNDTMDKALEQNMPFMHAYNTCDIALKDKKYKEAADCFGELLKKYDRNDIRYNYAVALAQIKEYNKAKKELEFIIENEQKHTQIVEASKNLNKQIDEVLSALRAQSNSLEDVKNNNVDAGDYFSDLKDHTQWEKPTNITVYIEEDPKKELFYKAFRQWNGALGGIVYFNITNNKNANIKCTYIDKAKGQEGGTTEWYYYEKEGKKYFNTATIQIARHSSITNKPFSDTQLYSIILHEIGHSLGISDHSPFKGDIMYYSTDSYLNKQGEISNRDVNTIKKIYKK